MKKQSKAPLSPTSENFNFSNIEEKKKKKQESKRLIDPSQIEMIKTEWITKLQDLMMANVELKQNH